MISKYSELEIFSNSKYFEIFSRYSLTYFLGFQGTARGTNDDKGLAKYFVNN